MRIAGREIRTKTRARPEPTRRSRCVLVADRARARFFTIDETREDSGPPLAERMDLVNPEGELTRNQNFSDTRSGRKGRAGVAGGGYALTKRMEGHEDEFDKRFSREVAAAAAELVRTEKAGELVVAASPRFLGHLRERFGRTLPKTITVSELPTDLTWHTPARIARKLGQEGLLQKKDLPEAAYRPRSRHPAKKKAVTKKTRSTR